MAKQVINNYENYLEGIEIGEIDFFDYPEDLGATSSDEFKYSPSEKKELAQEDERARLLDRLTTAWLSGSEMTRRNLADGAAKLNPKDHKSFVKGVNDLLK